MNPYNRHATREHWDAIADIIGPAETSELYGPRPEHYNSAESVERLYFNDKAPRRTLWAVVALTAILACSVAWGATHRTERAVIEPCALVLTRESGPECR